jgi:cytochrome c oxidase assembly protein subunit 15
MAWSLLMKIFSGKSVAWFAVAFALLVVVFGAFVRLSNAGLSCPDWPTCYGEATWPGHDDSIAAANAAFPQRPVETHKAWREQVHRMLAGTLGMLVLALALVAMWPRPRLRALVIAGAVAASRGVFAYMRGATTLALLLSAIAVALPLLAAARLDRPPAWRLAPVVFAVIIVQAMLGMWTVTLLLKPIVVMGHLLGGLATFALLGYSAFALVRAAGPPPAPVAKLKPLMVVALVLLAIQIALGGWTSANYAALACGFDFPKCLGQWWPPTDFGEGFVLWRGIGVNYEGGVLDAAARSAIQIAHRLGALVVFVALLTTATAAWRRGLRVSGAILAVLLCTQVALGIANVKLGLPLAVATAHNGVAALLLLTLVAMLARETGDGKRDT